MLTPYFKNTKGNELNTCVWGTEQNTVMHLALVLNQPELTQQLLDHSASTNIPNKSGHLPQPMSKPASDKFKRLRELAESPSINKTNIDRQNSTRKYFRPGHLEERKRRVLSEEEEAEKLKSARQKDIQLLAQRSAVKNNPLFKKFEEQQEPTTVKTAASRLKDRNKLVDAVDQIKRSSRVINSLKENSYVSSSIFRQQQEQQQQQQKPAPKVSSPFAKETPSKSSVQTKKSNAALENSTPKTDDTKVEILPLHDKATLSPANDIDQHTPITPTINKEEQISGATKIELPSNNGTIRGKLINIHTC